MAAAVKVVCLLAAFTVAAAPAAEASFQLTCDWVGERLIPCMNYLTGHPGPSTDCCNDVRIMDGYPDTRRRSCQCLKNIAAITPRLNNANAANLFFKCHAYYPYPISPDTDCSKVH